MKTRRMTTMYLAMALGALLTLSGCLDTATERADLDEAVGIEHAHGLSIDVEDGLAAVTSLDPGEVHLWSQSPVLELHLEADPGHGGEWTLVVHNVMSSSVLSTSGESTAGISELSSDAPTTKRWSLDLPEGSSTFHLSPSTIDPGTPWRFAVLSDIQEAVEEIDDVFGLMNDTPGLAFVVSTGDLTENGTEEQLVAIKTALEGLHIPFYSTAGNHDIGMGDALIWHELLGRHSFSWTCGGVTVSFIDMATSTVAAKVYDWLDEWLSGAEDHPHVLLGHVPIFDPIGTRGGGLRNHHEAAKLVQTLAEGGADLLLFGHIHSYYALSYGGVPAYISGGGGAIPEKLDGVGRHFLVIDVDPVAESLMVSKIEVD